MTPAIIQAFNVTYISDGTEIYYAIPNIFLGTDDVLVTLNGITQPPYTVYTVHQGQLRFVDGAPPAGFLIMIRSL